MRVETGQWAGWQVSFYEPLEVVADIQVWVEYIDGVKLGESKPDFR